MRVQALNSSGLSSGYDSGALLTVAGGVAAFSADRQLNVWYNASSGTFFAQGDGTGFYYSVTTAPASAPLVSGPTFNGSALLLSLNTGPNYFNVSGKTAGGLSVFGPVLVDTAAPTVPSITAVVSSTSPTVINLGNTNGANPRISWPAAAGSTSPIVGYSVSVSMNASDVPGPVITTAGLFFDASLPFTVAGTYYVKVSAIDQAGTLGPPTGTSFAYTPEVTGERITPKGNYFNPLTGACMVLEVDTVSSGHIKAEVYTLLGQKIATLSDSDASPGAHTYTWCGRNGGGQVVAAGAYLLRVQSPTQRKDVGLAVAK